MAANMQVCLPLIFFCYYLFVKCNGVAGAGRVNLLEQEDIELEKQLKLLNKPAIKTIKTQYGEIYDCVDFYKQPAFDHPLLKNHSYHFQMNPQFPQEKPDEISSGDTLDFGLPDGGCPIGTVPIKRITKEDLIRAKLASKAADFGGFYVAVARANSGTQQFTGAFGFASLWNPPVLERQYSASRIQLQNGNDFIKLGWRVDLTLYGDKFTHFYIQTNTSSTGNCFDVRCGFVLTRRDLSPGFIYPPNRISVKGGPTYESKIRVQKDQLDGKWWLSVGNNNARVGYWPKELLAGLSNSATYVDWGGEVNSPHLISAPQMGSGVIPTQDDHKDAYIRYITGININGKNFNVKTEPYTNDDKGIYKVLDLPGNRVFGHTAYFGGD